jgi:HSP20 family protein
MAIIRWQSPGSLDELDRLRHEVDQLFNDFSVGTEPLFSRAYPAVNVTQDGDTFYVRAEIPGVKREDLEISVVEGRLLLGGERKIDTGDKGINYHRRERDGGFFRRTIALPAKVEPDKVSATVKNGVLVIALPKSEETKARKITVKAT